MVSVPSGRRHLTATTTSSAPQYLAQVGKAVNFQPNYDSIGQAVLSVFVMITQDSYDIYMKMTMTLTNYWIACLFTFTTMVIGIYIFLNLFLAILLANLDQLEFDEPKSFLDTAKAIGSAASGIGSRIKSILMLDRIRQVNCTIRHGTIVLFSLILYS